MSKAEKCPMCGKPLEWEGTEISETNICDTCVYAPCLCYNEPENCVAYIERIDYNMDGGTDNETD